MNQERLNYLIKLIKDGAISIPKRLKPNRDFIVPIREKIDLTWIKDGEIPTDIITFKTETIKYEELGQLVTILGLPSIKAPDPIFRDPIIPGYFPNISFYPNIYPVLPPNFVYISDIEEPLTCELRDEAPTEPLTPIAKSIWEAIWPEPFPNINVIWGEHGWAPTETMGDWSEEKQRIRISFNNHIRGYRGEDEIRGKRNTGLIYTIVHELLHARGYEHDTLGLPAWEQDKIHDIYALEVEKALNILWEKIK